MLLQSLYFSCFLPNHPRPLSSFDTHARWPPVTQSAWSRWSYGKIDDCEQPRYNDTKDFLCLFRNWHNFCGTIWKWSSDSWDRALLPVLENFLKALFLLTWQPAPWSLRSCLMPWQNMILLEPSFLCYTLGLLEQYFSSQLGYSKSTSQPFLVLSRNAPSLLLPSTVGRSIAWRH